MNSPVCPLVNFASPSTYAQVLRTLHQRWARRGRLDRLQVEGLTMVELGLKIPELSRLLARVVAQGDYRWSPLEENSAMIEGKRRTLYRPTLLDAVVLTLLGQHLAVLAEAILPDTLYSYRRGRSPWGAIRAFTGYLGKHRTSTPLRQRGLYVLRCDVKKYGESIPTHPDSPLYGELERVLERDPVPRRRSLVRELAHAALRQPVRRRGGSVAPLDCGIPTGSPVQPIGGNLCLLPVDRKLAMVEGAFYARFGDDLLFAAPDPAIVTAAEATLKRELDRLGLTLKQEKTTSIYLNAAGRPSERAPEFRPTQSLEYLGALIDARGCLGLKQVKATALEREVARRLRRARILLSDAAVDELAEVLCSVVKSALDPASPLSLPGAEFLRAIASSRSQLRDLDYRFALLVAEAATGRRGVRAFRVLPYRRLRVLGLPSLAASRQRIASPGGAR